MTSFHLVNNQLGKRNVEDEIRQLFGENGEIYLVTGYFTYSAFDRLRSDIEQFLNRSAENSLTIIISAAVDQFSPSIARELRKLDTDDQVTLLKYPDGCLHAKLYLRTGDAPRALFGSANLTKVAFQLNFELNMVIEPTEEELTSLLSFVESLIDECEPVRSRDLMRPIMAYNSIYNWYSKGRLIQSNALIQHPGWLGLFLLILGAWWLISL